MFNNKMLCLLLCFYYIAFDVNTVSCVVVNNGPSPSPDASHDSYVKIELNRENPRHRITSSGFPNKNYPPNIDITYEIEMKLYDEVKQLGTRILIKFEMLSLEESELCKKDRLEIDDTINKIQVYCGQQIGRTILSEESKIYIRFFTNSKIESRGFSILLAMYNTGCSKHFQNMDNGEFSSPNYPERYYPNDLCVWKITAPAGKRILLEFDSTFDIRADEPLCTQDYLAVSLTGDFDTHFKRYCNGIRPVSMHSTGNSMLLMFNTDCCFEGQGFKAVFHAVDKEEVVLSPTPEPIPQLCNACGIENAEETERIIGGELIHPNRYPWLVALVNHPILSIYAEVYRCGGALINKQYVLTAAHCLDGKNTSQIRIAIGAYHTREPVTVEVEKFIPHPNYDKAMNKVNDIALIKLRSPLDFNNEVSPICLPTEKGLASVGDLATVAGWGRHGQYRAQTFPHEVQVPIRSQASCTWAFQNLRSTTILDTHICAGGELEKDACQGDSGGPLYVKKNGKLYLIGIVAFGYICGTENYPGVYTRVSKYLQWIAKEVSDSPPCDTVRPPLQPNFENCGLPTTASTGRTTASTELTPLEFPWMAIITLNSTVIGSGALISPHFVLTSASLFYELKDWQPHFLRVYLGIPSSKKVKPENYRIFEVTLHPQFETPFPYNNDIAILQLKMPFNFKGIIWPGVSFKPICLPRLGASYQTNMSLTTAGWGKISHSGSDVLRKANLNVWAEEQCEQAYPGWFTMLCAYKKDANTCSGDNGAPLMRLYYGRYYLVGLSSRNVDKNCAVINTPLVFSAVHLNLRWISSITDIEIE